MALRVPQVINSLTALGPNSEGVGEGIFGSNENPFVVGDLGRSTTNSQYNIHTEFLGVTDMVCH